MEAKESLGGKRSDLVQLWNRGQILEEMLKLLDQMYAFEIVDDISLLPSQRAFEGRPRPSRNPDVGKATIASFDSSCPKSEDHQ